MLRVFGWTVQLFVSGMAVKFIFVIDTDTGKSWVVAAIEKLPKEPTTMSI